MAGPVHHSGILPGNTDNVYSLAMVAIYIVAIVSSLIMEAILCGSKRAKGGLYGWIFTNSDWVILGY